MAVTKIKAIRSTLDKAVKYICNPEKTKGMLLVDSFGCVPEFAALQMEATARQNKRGGCRKAYHLMQSFAPEDNITPEKAGDRQTVRGRRHKGKAPVCHSRTYRP